MSTKRRALEKVGAEPYGRRGPGTAEPYGRNGSGTAEHYGRNGSGTKKKTEGKSRKKDKSKRSSSSSSRSSRSASRSSRSAPRSPSSDARSSRKCTKSASIFSSDARLRWRTKDRMYRRKTGLESPELKEAVSEPDHRLVHSQARPN